MGRNGYGIALICFLISSLFLSACAADMTDGAADAGSTEQYFYSELAADGKASGFDVVKPSQENPLAPDFTCQEAASGISVSFDAESSDAMIGGEYASALADGALLTVEENGSFLYRLARRYTYVADDSFTFDLVFRVYGTLPPADEGLLFLIDHATVACTSLSNGTEAEQLLAQNYLYSEYGLELNERMISGQALSLDEFIGNGTLAQLFSTPIYVTLDEQSQEFTLVGSPFSDWASGNSVFTGSLNGGIGSDMQ